MYHKKRNSDPLVTTFLLALILGLSIYLGYHLRLEGPALFDRLLGKTVPNPPVTTQTQVDWRKLERIRSYIEGQYNGPIVDEKLLEGALKGLVGTLDNGGGQYFNAVEFNEILTRNQKTHGAGIQLGVRDGRIIILSLEPDSQGETAGLLPGDVIFKLNDMVVTAAEIETARNALRSNENRTVQLNILRGEGHEEINVRLRELVKPGIITQYEDHIGVIRLPSVSLDLDQEFQSVVDDLVREGAKALVLDLRDTATGQVTETVRIASLFIPEGKTVVTIRDTKGRLRDFTSDSGRYSQLPLAVLINGQTEGSAEFAAGALKEQEKVTVIGSATLGEGRIFSYINLPEGEGIKLATGFFLLPTGAPLHGRGISPDLLVPGDRVQSPNLVKPEDAPMARAFEVLSEQLAP